MFAARHSPDLTRLSAALPWLPAQPSQPVSSARHRGQWRPVETCYRGEEGASRERRGSGETGEWAGVLGPNLPRAGTRGNQELNNFNGTLGSAVWTQGTRLECATWTKINGI